MTDTTKETPAFGNANLPLSSFRFTKEDSKLILAHLVFSFIALFIGGFAGLLQGLERGGLVKLPPQMGYYQLLTAHGVLLALVFTTVFIVGFFYSGIARTLGKEMSKNARTFAWIGYYLMVIGSIVATITILTNDATVLYTFYAPMQASPWFYVGAAFLIVGSWFSAIAIFISYVKWRREHHGKASPLFAFMAVATMVLWIHATLGVVIEVVFQLIPWSFGWMPRMNVTISRTLFWYFGHALVYFWLLPAYVYWYVNLPKIIGGKIFSDALPRLTFLLFVLFSIPVGFHHQLNEPGIESFWKYLQVTLTMMVVVPSLLTAFSIMATFELAGREKGAKRMFDWVKKMPWKDARFFAPAVAMIIFIFGGAGGVILASYQLNSTVHNTWFVTGHFHMTLASTVLLTFFGIAIWLIPALNGRLLTPAINKLAIAQTIIWATGMTLMSGTMHIVGLMGAPRRSAFSTYGDHEVALSWLPYQLVISIGGVLLFIGVMLALFNFFYLLYFAPRAEKPVDYPIGEFAEHVKKPPKILERWSVWIGISIVLSIIAYSVPIMQMFQHDAPGSIPFRTW